MTNKSCIVLGLGPSTGASVARRFAREGYAVAVAARRLEVLEPVVADIEAAGGRALAVPTDATDEPRRILAPSASPSTTRAGESKGVFWI
jgi:NAD(P)-dependent dehydrogenase (short-subunit alcohol dehydrogenase family)